jgi:indolepyruvate ferredoxin oxidoreductase beta subunit
MDTRNILLCGLGGQGILFMTKILAQTALNKGFDIMGAETHGMAQRGGSVVSHLRLGQAESSLVRTGSAHILLALEKNEGYRNLPFLSNGARMFVNAGTNDFPTDTVKDFLEKKQVTCHTIPASELADDLGAPLSSNLALLGFFSAFDQESVTHTELRATIENISPDRFKDNNLKVFDAGHQKGLENA